MSAPNPRPPPLASFELDGYRLDVAHYLNADYSDVSVASAELPAVNEWINEKLQAYVEMLHITRAELAEAEATAYFTLRKGAFADDYGGKQTEESLKHAVALDPEVKKLVRSEAVLSAWCGRLRGVQSSLSMKLDLVRSSEATRRKVFDETSS